MKVTNNRIQELEQRTQTITLVAEMLGKIRSLPPTHGNPTLVELTENQLRLLCAAYRAVLKETSIDTEDEVNLVDQLEGKLGSAASKLEHDRTMQLVNSEAFTAGTQHYFVWGEFSHQDTMIQYLIDQTSPDSTDGHWATFNGRPFMAYPSDASLPNPIEAVEARTVDWYRDPIKQELWSIHNATGEAGSTARANLSPKVRTAEKIVEKLRQDNSRDFVRDAIDLINDQQEATNFLQWATQHLTELGYTKHQERALAVLKSNVRAMLDHHGSPMAEWNKAFDTVFKE